MKILAAVFFLLVVAAAPVAADPDIFCTVVKVQEDAVSGECAVRWDRALGKSEVRWEFGESVETTDDPSFRIAADEFGRGLRVRAYVWDEAARRIRRPSVEICWDVEHRVLVHRAGGRAFSTSPTGEVEDLPDDYDGACFAEAE